MKAALENDGGDALFLLLRIADHCHQTLHS
jgi:hypothetical protein